MKFDLNCQNKRIRVTPEIARIHAHVCGDGSYYKINEKRSPGSLLKHKRRNIHRIEHIIEYYNEYQKLLDEFKRDFKIAFNRNIITNKRKIKVRGAKWIAEKLELTNKTTYNWYIPSFIMNAPKKVISSWLRAIFDDEGSIRGNGIYLDVVNKKGIIQIAELLKKIEINSKLYKPYKPKNPNHKTRYRIGLHGKNVIKYSKYVSFVHPKKKEKLKLIVKKLSGIAGI